MNNLKSTSNTITCVIVDDDPFIQELLKDKLNQYFPEINIVGLGNDGKEGIEKIIVLKPDLVFLDVEMTDMTGFEMLSRLASINFKTIFITSYKHYAIKAIRFNALDYLLKPFDLEELKNAIKRFKNNYNAIGSSYKVDIALNNIKTKNISDQVLSLKTQQGDLHLVLKDIISIEGDRNYSNIYLTGNRKELVSKTLSDLEDLLSNKGFFRCHKSHLISKNHIVELTNSFNILLSNGMKIPISRRKKEAFQGWLIKSNH
ncbi:LytR/AlgR family response regulator transcription factor [Formosa maritima]|uniref:Response regulator transcription factor n=1 Tax=Formosa maritima TaxID=2592046 RepID=A0A5D0G7V5_9FLAO|nr:LytTR family DNA-binding domain-containing protein [Formosa maritima]TYA54771.1 response regulator transcription factor [Formosa maritima]